MARALIKEALLTHRFYYAIAGCLLLLEAAANYQIIQRVRYTEIDWKAYMQEVRGVLDGERNYLNLKGDTGPLVYPAGFVWIYQVLYRLTAGGADLRLAQYVFMAVYLATLAAVLYIYKRTQVPPGMLVLLVVSKRLHSIYVLRLFNDAFAMLPAYLAVAALVSPSARLQRCSGVLLSLGIAVKMNVQLLLPGAAYIWWRQGGVLAVCAQLGAVVATQAVVAAPFLAAFPSEYMARAFDYGRQFDFAWTVNWRFVGREVFLSREWAMLLLAAHAVLLAVLTLGVWPRLSGRTAWSVVRDGLAWPATIQCRQRGGAAAVTAAEVATVLFTANFVGVLCARSLHYQFYAWYFHMLPLLLHVSRLPLAAQAAAWAAIEYAWNVYPSTNTSSAVLLAAHVAVLGGILRSGLAARAPDSSIAKIKIQ
ncbi:dolichyl-P-Man:Man(5)GlcNAc(2)-PP-dolichol alpha-1,3-mannosyltransferase [Coemansia sp. Benny D115]|nr:dolichyl-P-Man:Man(5)GlcNAc(2)-PP-dolichol alpha-1,3-mannosyltransferase [Coemansia sp. Benny D115]